MHTVVRQLWDPCLWTRAIFMHGRERIRILTINRHHNVETLNSNQCCTSRSGVFRRSPDDRILHLPSYGRTRSRFHSNADEIPDHTTTSLKRMIKVSERAKAFDSACFLTLIDSRGVCQLTIDFRNATANFLVACAPRGVSRTSVVGNP